MLTARRRLDQARVLWHRALAAYADVDEFRLELNALIPALRSSTWLLQKELRHRDGFEDWYKERQEAMRADPVLRWVVEARNQIEKRGDLELKSTARVSVIADWLPARYEDLEVPPLFPPGAIANYMAESGVPERIRRDGVLRVERRWVSENIPDLELLHACARAYARLGALLSEAEALFDDAEPGPVGSPPPVPACMAAGTETRTAHLHLERGELVKVERATRPFHPDDSSRAAERYGEAIKGPYRGDTFVARMEGYHAINRRVFEVDGHHVSVAMFLRHGVLIDQTVLEMGDQQEKYLVIEAVAQHAMATGADEVILTFESWMARALPPSDPRGHQRAGERDDREEALISQGITREGDVLTLISPVKRDPAGTPVLSPVVQNTGMAQILLPIANVWREDEPATGPPRGREC